jgi:hypothetical protein
MCIYTPIFGPKNMSYSKPVNRNTEDFISFSRDFIFDLSDARSKASQVTFLLDGLSRKRYDEFISWDLPKPSARPGSSNSLILNDQDQDHDDDDDDDDDDDGYCTYVPEEKMTATKYSKIKYENDPLSNSRYLLESMMVSDLTPSIENKTQVLKALGLEEIKLQSYSRTYLNPDGSSTVYYSIEFTLSLFVARLDHAAQVALGQRRNTSPFSQLSSEIMGEYILPAAGGIIHHRKLFYATDDPKSLLFTLHLLQNSERTLLDHICRQLEESSSRPYKKRLIFQLPHQAALNAMLIMFESKMAEVEGQVHSRPRPHYIEQRERFQMMKASPHEIIPREHNNLENLNPWWHFIGNTSEDVKDVFTAVNHNDGPSVVKFALQLNPDDSEGGSFDDYVHLAFVAQTGQKKPYILVVLPLAKDENIRWWRYNIDPDLQDLRHQYSFLYFFRKLVQWAIGKKQYKP